MKHLVRILVYAVVTIAGLTLPYYGHDYGHEQGPQPVVPSMSRATSIATGVRGSVLLGAACPFPLGAITGTPYRAAVTAVRRGTTKPIANVRAGADGSFLLALTPGAYTLSAYTAKTSPVCLPLELTVPATGYALATICCTAAP